MKSVANIVLTKLVKLVTIGYRQGVPDVRPVAPHNINPVVVRLTRLPRGEVLGGSFLGGRASRLSPFAHLGPTSTWSTNVSAHEARRSATLDTCCATPPLATI